VNISEVRKSPDKMVIADIDTIVLSAKEQKTEEVNWNGSSWVQTSQWVLLKCKNATEGEQNEEDVIGCNIVGKPVMNVGDQLLIRSTSGKKGFNGIMIKHWMSKEGDPRCGLTVTKTAHITKNGESYNNVHENAVPTVLNKPSASQNNNQRVVSDLSDLQARLFKEYVGLFPNVSTETVFTEARLDANTLFIKGTKDTVNLVDLRSFYYLKAKSEPLNMSEEFLCAEAGAMCRTAFIQGLKVPEDKQASFDSESIPF